MWTPILPEVSGSSCDPVVKTNQGETPSLAKCCRRCLSHKVVPSGVDSRCLLLCLGQDPLLTSVSVKPGPREAGRGRPCTAPASCVLRCSLARGPLSRLTLPLCLYPSARSRHGGASPASPLQNTFRTPVYTTSMRRNAMGVGLVFEADLFTTRHISHWVLQGVCLTLNSD